MHMLHRNAPDRNAVHYPQDRTGCRQSYEERLPNPDVAGNCAIWLRRRRKIRQLLHCNLRDLRRTSMSAVPGGPADRTGRHTATMRVGLTRRGSLGGRAPTFPTRGRPAPISCTRPGGDPKPCAPASAARRTCYGRLSIHQTNASYRVGQGSQHTLSLAAGSPGRCKVFLGELADA